MEEQRKDVNDDDADEEEEERSNSEIVRSSVIFSHDHFFPRVPLIVNLKNITDQTF